MQEKNHYFCSRIITIIEKNPKIARKLQDILEGNPVEEPSTGERLGYAFGSAIRRSAIAGFNSLFSSHKGKSVPKQRASIVLAKKSKVTKAKIPRQRSLSARKVGAPRNR